MEFKQLLRGYHQAALRRYRECGKRFIWKVWRSAVFFTGEFHFPNDKAAQIAVNTVKELMWRESSVKKVVFNVFKDLDKEIYSRLLG